MFNPRSLMMNRTSREILRELRRTISRTSSASNSEAIISSRQQQEEFNGGAERHTKSKWIKINRQNNIRALSTIQTKVKPPLVSTPFFSKEESREFMAIFPDIVRDLTDAGRHTDIPEVTKRFAKVLQYNVPTGKKIRGLSTVIAYKILEKPENLTPENIRLANVLGWCVEMLQAFGVMMDDIIDKQQVVGTGVTTDASLLENSVYVILKKHLNQHPMYHQLQELFTDVTMKSSMGKALDCTITNGGRPDLKQFTMKNYNLIMKYRTGYYSFQLPVAAAMYLANMNDAEQHRQAKTILLELGQFFHIQKDFMNCFGAPELVDRVGSDINEGRCTWLAVVALQRATNGQRKIMEEQYGKPGQEAVETIKDLYIQLGLPATYAAYEEESYNIIHTHIQQISKGLPHELFFTLMDKLYAYQ